MKKVNQEGGQFISAKAGLLPSAKGGLYVRFFQFD